MLYGESESASLVVGEHAAGAAAAEEVDGRVHLQEAGGHALVDARAVEPVADHLGHGGPVLGAETSFSTMLATVTRSCSVRSTPAAAEIGSWSATAMNWATISRSMSTGLSSGVKR